MGLSRGGYSKVDALAQHYYELRFELLFLKAHGDAFQQLFGRIMSMAYPGDFVQTRPWGRLGDEKCDGYLRSQRKLFQCYAPNELEMSETLRKMHDDFNGALPYAQEFFDTWVFTHNAEGGRIPTWLIKDIERLEKEHASIRIELFGFEEMRRIVFSLSPTDLVSLLGPSVTMKAMMSLGLADLKPILTYLERQAPPEDDIPRPVPAEKLAYNALGSNVEALLKAGMTKARLVEDYISRGANKELGMRVAAAFRHEYNRLRTEELDGIEIFDHLRQFALGPYKAETNTEVACLAVLAYLFEACDIFESPESVAR